MYESESLITVQTLILVYLNSKIFHLFSKIRKTVKKQKKLVHGIHARCTCVDSVGSAQCVPAWIGMLYALCTCVDRLDSAHF